MNHKNIWDAIDHFADAQKMTCSGLARKSGLDPTAFNRSKRQDKYGKPHWPSTHSIAKILEATGSTFYDFACFFPSSNS